MEDKNVTVGYCAMQLIRTDFYADLLKQRRNTIWLRLRRLVKVNAYF